MNRTHLTIILIIVLLLLSLARGHIIASIVGQSHKAATNTRLGSCGMTSSRQSEKQSQISTSVESPEGQG